MKIKNIVTKITSISEKNKMLILFLVLLSGWFYWFQYRPTIIRKECGVEAVEQAISFHKYQLEIAPGELNSEEKAEIDGGVYLVAQRDKIFDYCLHKRGLK